MARKLAQDLRRRKVLLPNQGKATWENAAKFAYDVDEGFQRKKQTLAVGVDLEDAYKIQDSAIQIADETPCTI